MIPGYRVPLAGPPRWLVGETIVVIELPTGVYRVTDDADGATVHIDADEVRRAASGVANLIAAKLHEARRTAPADEPEPDVRRLLQREWGA